MINTIKNKLSTYLNEATQQLTNEDISILLKIKEDGLSPIIKNIVDTRSFQAFNLINIAYALNTNNESIKHKIEEDNHKLLKELNRVDNDLIFTEIVNKFYEPKNADNLRVVTKLSDVKTSSFNAKSIFDVPFIQFDKAEYINPYNNAKFELDTRTETGSNITTLTDPLNRSITSTVTMSILSQCDWFDSSGRNNSGLDHSYTKKQIARMGVEFVFFHELAHSSARKYSFEKNDDETFADICGIIQVVKNNDFSKNDAINFVNRVIAYRSSPNSIFYYATDFENDAKTSKNRIHFTQDSLFFLRELFETSLKTIKEMSITEHAIFASNLVLVRSCDHTNENIKDRLNLCSEKAIDVFIDDLLAIEKDYINDIATEKKISPEDLIKRIKLNVKDDPRKILDLNLHIIFKHDEPLLYQIPSFSIFDNKFMMAKHQQTMNEYKAINMERNFTYGDLVKELDKHDIKRKPKI